MLQVNFLRENKERVLEGLQKRQFKGLGLVDEAIATDEERKKIQFELDSQLSEINKISKEIGMLMKDGKTYPSICITKEEFPRIYKTRNINKKAENKKSKELQEEWLKKNRVKKVNAF